MLASGGVGWLIDLLVLSRERGNELRDFLKGHYQLAGLQESFHFLLLAYCIGKLGPPVVPFYPFFGEGSPTKIDHRKRGTLILTTGGPGDRKGQAFFCHGPSSGKWCALSWLP